MANDEQTAAEQFDAFDDHDDGARLDDLPPDTLWGAAAYGEGGADAPDTLAARVAREEPEDPVPPAGVGAALYEPGDPLGDDVEAQMVGEIDDQSPGRMSPEENAVHVIDEATAVRAAGLDPDGPAGDGYVENEHGEVQRAHDGTSGTDTALA